MAGSIVATAVVTVARRLTAHAPPLTKLTHHGFQRHVVSIDEVGERRSGSGKSTLVRSLAGIKRLDEGQLWLSGQLASAGSRHLPPERRNLAMVFQDYVLWPHLTVLGKVGYALRRRLPDNVTARERVHAALERVGLGGHAERYPHELSGGEQQRVALTRAVVARPQLLLFDEPLSDLDADLRELLRFELATLTRESGATAVYITHDQSEAFAPGCWSARRPPALPLTRTAPNLPPPTRCTGM